MRAYYIQSGNAGCYGVRCLLPLVANGWDGDSTSFKYLDKTPENKMLATKQADVVVFHRPEDKKKLELARILKKQGKKIVYDNDDTYKDHDAVKVNDFFDAERVRLGLDKVNKLADQFLIEADLVTTTTEWLAKEYRKLNSNVLVLPNYIDPFYFDEPIRNETDIVRIGISGSIGVTTDIDVLAPIVRHYEHDNRVKIIFFSLPPNRKENPKVEAIYKDEYAFLDSVDVEWHPTVNSDEYYDKLNSLKLDIMIIPRADNYFNRAKSNLKFIETSMFGIPIIAQGFADGMSPYQVNPDDQKYMKIIMDEKEWVPAIEAMIADKEGRREQGRLAREYVTKNYNIEDHAHKWEDAYKAIL